MKKFLLTIFLLLASVSIVHAKAATITFYSLADLKSNQCDNLTPTQNPGRYIATSDMAMGYDSGVGAFLFYVYDANGSDSESSPTIIVPNDRGDCTTGQWNLKGLLSSGVSVPGTNYGPQLGIFLEKTGNGSNYVGIGSPASNDNDLILLFPTSDPLPGQVLTCTTPSSVTFADNIARDATQCSWIYPGGALTPVTDTGANFAANFTGQNLYGGTFRCTTDGTLALPNATVNMAFTITDFGGTPTIEPLATGTDDTIILNEATCGQGVNIVGDGTTGGMAVFQYLSPDTWMVTANGFSCGS